MGEKLQWLMLREQRMAQLALLLLSGAGESSAFARICNFLCSRRLRLRGHRIQRIGMPTFIPSPLRLAPHVLGIPM
jgi:hypothetical protein